MNVTVEVSNNQAIGGFIILGIVVGVSITFCYFKKFRGGSRGGASAASAVVHNSPVTETDVVVI